MTDQSVRLPQYLPGIIPPKIIDKNEICDCILSLMIDIEKNATDTYFATESETIFDRLADIYLSSGGLYRVLKKQFPHYYD